MKASIILLLVMSTPANNILDMFRALKQSELPSENVFSVTVGASSKQTLASWHLLEPHDVISCISLLNGSIDNENVGAVSVVDGTVPEMTEARL